MLLCSDFKYKLLVSYFVLWFTPFNTLAFYFNFILKILLSICWFLLRSYKSFGFLKYCYLVVSKSKNSVLQEQVVMNLDSRLLIFPLYICCNFLYISPENRTENNHHPENSENWGSHPSEIAALWKLFRPIFNGPINIHV